MSESQITFFSEGTRLQGTLSIPQQMNDMLPAVALFHGYGAFRDELTGYSELAELLANKGIISLRFDFRGCGESGEPGAIHPHDEWIEDARSAVSFLERHPAVDPRRIGVVGMSVGGGVAVQATALDPRVKCAVALAPVADGSWWLQHLWELTQGEEGWKKFLARLAEDRRNSAIIGKSEKVVMEEILAYGPNDMAARRTMLKKFPQFATHALLSSADSLLQFQPRQFVHLIAPRPLRIIHGLADTSVPIKASFELFGRAGETRDLQLIPDAPHCFWLDKSSTAVQKLTLEWFEKYL